LGIRMHYGCRVNKFRHRRMRHRHKKFGSLDTRIDRLVCDRWDRQIKDYIYRESKAFSIN
jgi:hypothetical protein